MTPSPLKVFSCNYDGKHRVVLATTSRSAMARTLRVPVSDVNEARDTQAIAVAMGLPGWPFALLYERKPSDGWERMRRFPDGAGGAVWLVPSRRPK